MEYFYVYFLRLAKKNLFALKANRLAIAMDSSNWDSLP